MAGERSSDMFLEMFLACLEKQRKNCTGFVYLFLNLSKIHINVKIFPSENLLSLVLEYFEYLEYLE